MSAAAFGTAAKVLEAEYTTSINIHAPLEPMNATAQFSRAISWHIYSGNQFCDALRRDCGGCGRGRSQIRRDAPDVAGRRLRPAVSTPT